MNDFLDKPLIKGDKVVFFYDDKLMEGEILSGGKKRATILSTKNVFKNSFFNDKGLWDWEFEDIPYTYSIGFKKIYKI